MFLQLESCGIRDEDVDHIASHIAVGVGVADSLKSLGERKSSGMMVGVPAELTLKHEVPSGVFYSEMDNMPEASSTALKDAVFEFATVGNSHLEHAKDSLMSEAGKKLLAEHKGAKDVFLGRVAAEQWLKKLEEADFDIMDPRVRGGGKDDFWVQIELLKKKFF